MSHSTGENSFANKALAVGREKSLAPLKRSVMFRKIKTMINQVTITIAIGLSLLVQSKCFAANEYIEAGVPSYDREWIGSDYVQASEALKKGSVELPSKKGGAKFFDRMVSESNLNTYRNTTLPLKYRLALYKQLLDGTSAFLLIYLESVSQGQPLTEELSRLMVFLLKVSVVGFALVEEKPPGNKDDLDSERRIEGLKEIKAGITKIFLGAEYSLGETIFYSQADINLLAQGMRETLPSLKPYFSEDFKKELIFKFQEKARSTKNSTLLDHLNAMIKELET